MLQTAVTVQECLAAKVLLSAVAGGDLSRGKLGKRVRAENVCILQKAKADFASDYTVQGKHHYSFSRMKRNSLSDLLYIALLHVSLFYPAF